ncbi:hypothetical protein Syun_005205 [Stephania yunnanensis]|uniref:Uncharacterized protein n=1 Tax=Stephania yunnanensis TaxID=152371 RepID=A0AAP0Q207_9MAGN
MGGKGGGAAGAGGNGGGGNPKIDEFQPHPVKLQLPGVEYCVSSSPWWPEAIVLGFQHYLVALGTIVLIPSVIVPLMGGGDEEKARLIQTLLFVTGLNTLLQTHFGTRLPVVMGGSSTYILPIRFLRTMRGIQGAVIVASLFQIIVGFLGFWRNVVWLLSPLSAAPLVIMVGLGLYRLGFPKVSKCIEIGLPELVLVVFISLYLPRMLSSKRSIFERSAVLFSVAVVWAYAHILTVAGVYDNKPPKTQFSCRTDRSGLLGATPWIKVPTPFQWGRPTFEAGEAFAVMAASLVSLIETYHTFLCDSENAGFLGMTRVGSRRVINISALFMLFFSILGKFGALFASIPLPIVAALYCILFAYVASAGLGLLQFCNLNSFRTKFILGISIFMGFSVPQYFIEHTIFSGHGPVHTGSKWFNDMVNVIFSSHATVAAIVAVFLDCTLHLGDPAIRRDSGYHWWEKFRYFKTDTNSEDFYSLPWGLTKYFPSI